jgi:non-ribosomal peptide synthetase component E (peptide arylation enzyme)
VDALDTSRSISNRQARAIVEKLAAGFKKAGLKEGDCVCMHAFNDVRFSVCRRFLRMEVVEEQGVCPGSKTED